MPRLALELVDAPDEIKKSLQKLSSHITFEKQASKGGNGYLFFGYNQVVGRSVAVKYYYYGSNALYHAEPRQLAKVKDAHVLAIYDASLVDGSWAYFVTPFCVRGDLDDVLESTQIGNTSAINLVCQILSGLSALHGLRFVHRDLKPQNILVSDDGEALIGDFGSVRSIPADLHEVPGSGHALLYRPPESISRQLYSFAGDLYQVGLVLYQLLGGYLPYEPTTWLNRKERVKYDAMSDSIDRDIFVSKVLKGRIQNGGVLDICSLPAWVPNCLRRSIKRACNIDPGKRFASASAFIAHIHSLRSQILDWVVIDGCPTLRGSTAYRICTSPMTGTLFVEKRRDSNWRRDNSILGVSQRELVQRIEAKIRR